MSGPAEMAVFIMPGDTFLCDVFVDYMPGQGMFIDYLDAETGVTTRYRVDDIYIDIVETASAPIQGGGGSSPIRHQSRLRVEVAEVP